VTAGRYGVDRTGNETPVDRPGEGLQAAHGTALASIVRGMVVAMAGSLFGGGLGFVFLVVMGRELSQTQFGLVVLAINLLTSAAALTIVGADLAAIRYIAAARTPGGKRGAMRTPLLVAVTFNVAVALLIIALARPLAVHALGQPRFATPLRVLALALPLTVAAQMLSALVSGLEKSRGELVRKVVEQGSRIVFGVTAVGLGFGVVGTVAGLAAAAFAAVVACGLLLLQALPRGGRTEALPVRSVVGFAWPQTIANAVGQVWLLVTIAFVSQWTGARGLAIFGAAAAIGRLPALVYNSFAYRFTPTISRLWEGRQLEEFNALLHGVTRWIAISAVPMYAVAIALPGPLLRIFGHGFESGKLALAVVAAAFLIDSLAGPVDRALIMTGHVRLEMVAGIVTTLTTLPPTLLLIHSYGISGAAISVVVYNIVLNGLKVGFVWWKLRMTPLSRGLLGPVLSGAVAGGATALLAANTSLGASLPGAALLVFFLLVVYATLEIVVVGISPVDRTAMRLSMRPEA
jgi:O-antigen/teichoic acid export membrane protein